MSGQRHPQELLLGLLRRCNLYRLLVNHRDVLSSGQLHTGQHCFNVLGILPHRHPWLSAKHVVVVLLISPRIKCHVRVVLLRSNQAVQHAFLLCCAFRWCDCISLLLSLKKFSSVPQKYFFLEHKCRCSEQMEVFRKVPVYTATEVYLHVRTSLVLTMPCFCLSISLRLLCLNVFTSEPMRPACCCEP